MTPGMETPRHLHWDAEGLWQSLQPLLPGLSVEVLARCDSTNTRLLERARAATPHRGESRASAGSPARAADDAAAMAPGRRAADTQPCLLVAEHQTHGRGRQGREWLAAPGASLTLSLALSLAPRDWSGLSLAVGLAVAEALDPWPSTPALGKAAGAPAAAGPPRLWLKWPNDLFFCPSESLAIDDPVARAGAARKLGGILIETVSHGAQRMVVIGIGLNIAPQQRVGSGFTPGSACLQELDPAATAPGALHRLALPLVQAVLDFEREGFGPSQAAYARRDLLVGGRVSAGTDDQLEVLGVDEDGALRVRPPARGEAGPGAPRRLISGEVSIRLEEKPAAGAAEPS
jgi:BirA family transcriptional regulator, biotin operon repressor / biotin---[acetyl-CoA-carboxylase] ligase